MLNPAWQDRDIWGAIDDEESSSLATITMKRGKQSPIAASIIRTAVDSHDWTVVIAWFFPRMKDTVELLRSAPKRQRKPLKLVRSMES